MRGYHCTADLPFLSFYLYLSDVFSLSLKENLKKTYTYSLL